MAEAEVGDISLDAGSARKSGLD